MSILNSFLGFNSFGNPKNTPARGLNDAPHDVSAYNANYLKAPTSTKTPYPDGLPPKLNLPYMDKWGWTAAKGENDSAHSAESYNTTYLKKPNNSLFNTKTPVPIPYNKTKAMLNLASSTDEKPDLLEIVKLLAQADPKKWDPILEPYTKIILVSSMRALTQPELNAKAEMEQFILANATVDINKLNVLKAQALAAAAAPPPPPPPTPGPPPPPPVVQAPVAPPLAPPLAAPAPVVQAPVVHAPVVHAPAPQVHQVPVPAQQFPQPLFQPTKTTTTTKTTSTTSGDDDSLRAIQKAAEANRAIKRTDNMTAGMKKTKDELTQIAAKWKITGIKGSLAKADVVRKILASDKIKGNDMKTIFS
jgi:hypothetical protein